jgi:hypothetical protein
MAGPLCRGCRGSALDTVVDLGDVPASDAFPRLDDPTPDPAWPLTLALCTACHLVQLGPTNAAAPEPPVAVESATSLAHAVASADAVVTTERLQAGDTFIEIDSHHGGSWRDEFTWLGLREVTADDAADLVVDVHGLPHEPDAWTPLAEHATRLKPGGRLVLEFHHLLPLVEQSQIDTIRHGHWIYLSALALDSLLDYHGLRLTRAVQTPAFGGSLRLTAMRQSDDPEVDASVDDILAAERAAGLADVAALRRLGQRGRERAAALHRHLEEAASGGRQVAGYGAPSKAAVLLALAAVDRTLLPYTVDLAPAKHGCRIPGVGVPILPVETLAERRPDEVVVLTWDIADEIVEQLSSLGLDWNPTIYVPMPEPQVLSLT